MSNFLILYPTGNLADLCLDSMYVTLYCHICKFGFVYENINIFLSNDHIWS